MSAGSGFDLKIRDGNNEKNTTLPTAPQNFVTPGTIITREPGFMRL